MPINWNIIKPKLATNYLLNPGFELWLSAGTTLGNWSLLNAPTVTQDNVNTWKGRASAKMVNQLTTKAIYQDVTLTNGNTYDLTGRVFVAAGSAKVEITAFGGAQGSGLVTTLSTAGWNKVDVTRVASGGGLRVLLYPGTGTDTISFDVFQLEDGAVSTTWFDGDQQDCYWTAGRFISTSIRPEWSREGGTPIPLTNYLSGIKMMGTGAAPVHNVSLPFGLIGGEQYQRTIKQGRPFSLSGVVNATSLANLHSLRRNFYDLLKYDEVVPMQPFKMQYDDQNSVYKLEIRAAYDAGFELNDMRGFTDWATLRFFAFDPLFYDERDDVIDLAIGQSVGHLYFLKRDRLGTWSGFGSDPNGQVFCSTIGPDGGIYIGGSFTSVGGVANTIGIAKWINGAWTAVGTGAANGTVYAMDFDLSGNLWVTGSFTQMGGVLNTARIAKWAVGGTWQALGTGLSGTGFAIKAGELNSGVQEIYVGGLFATANGVTVNNIATWNGTTFVAWGTGTNGQVNAIVTVIGTGVKYIGGSFTTTAGTGGSTVNGIAKFQVIWYPSFGGGVAGGTATVQSLFYSQDGLLYVGGNFTTAGGVTVNNVANWNGVNWTAMGLGVSISSVGVMDIAADLDGNIWLGGDITNIKSPATLVTPWSGIAVWNGTVYVPIDFGLQNLAVPQVSLIMFDSTGALYLGGSFNTVVYGGQVLDSTNIGTAQAYPTITFNGGIPMILTNYTTSKSIYFDGSLLSVNEVATLDLRPGRVSFGSNVRPNLLNTLLPGSDLNFFLVPGVNKIMFFPVPGASVTTNYITYSPAYWSLDGVEA